MVVVVNADFKSVCSAMVVTSPRRMKKGDNTVVNGGDDQEVTTDNQSSMASGGSSTGNGRESKSRVEIEKETVKAESERDSGDTQPVERRFSARIQKLKSEKASFVNRLEEAPNSRPEQCWNKRPKVYQRRKGNSREESEEVVGEAVSPTVGSSEAVDDDSAENGESKNPEIVENVIVNDVSTANGVEKSAYAKVKETLRIFNKFYLHFVQVSNWKPIFFPIKYLPWIFRTLSYV